MTDGEEKYYYISFVSRENGTLLWRVESAVIDEHPIDWICEVSLNLDIRYHLLYSMEISKRMYDKYEDLLG